MFYHWKKYALDYFHFEEEEKALNVGIVDIKH